MTRQNGMHGLPGISLTLAQARAIIAEAENHGADYFYASQTSHDGSVGVDLMTSFDSVPHVKTIFLTDSAEVIA